MMTIKCRRRVVDE